MFTASAIHIAIDNCHRSGARRQTKAPTTRRSIRIGATNSRSTSPQWNRGRRNKWYVLLFVHWVKECVVCTSCKRKSLSLHIAQSQRNFWWYSMEFVHLVSRLLQQCSARQNFSNQHPNDIITGNSNVWPVGKCLPLIVANISPTPAIYWLSLARTHRENRIFVAVKPISKLIRQFFNYLHWQDWRAYAHSPKSCLVLAIPNHKPSIAIDYFTHEKNKKKEEEEEENKLYQLRREEKRIRMKMDRLLN